jgi:hypothetical protein
MSKEESINGSSFALSKNIGFAEGSYDKQPALKEMMPAVHIMDSQNDRRAQGSQPRCQAGRFDSPLPTHESHLTPFGLSTI